MPIHISRAGGVLVLLVAGLFVLACGDADSPESPDAGAPPAVITPSGAEVAAMAKAADAAEPTAKITIDYPLDESVFPPEFVPPTFLWHDAEPTADTWLIEVTLESADGEPIRLAVPGVPPPKGEVDMEAFSETNEPYEGTDYQNSARSWTPTKAVWDEIKRGSVRAAATLTFSGFRSADLATPVSRGEVRILTSKDPVGAPIFYRDVPLMPGVGETGRIKPLGTKAIPLIAWRLKDVSRPDSKLVLKGMSSCGNCHSFALDGKTLGMDVDGPDGDKGMYAIEPVSKEMVIDYDSVITWNSFRDKPEGHRTIGFLSRVSPDGRHVVSTVNEAVYVANFTNYKFLQVFYPTRGILAVYSREEDRMRALPGADDPEYVHCGGVWSPDGTELIFMRGTAQDPYPEGRPLPKFSNDPNELPMRYDLYRIPFNGGAGGKAVPVEGASGNGMSNTFAKVSPDGRWIVFTKCGNGLLMRPDSRLWIVPYEGGEAREMRCNTNLMNSWHSWSPNSRWLVFSSKSNRPYTQAFLTHVDEDGNDSPAILVPNCTAANRAVNLPEFLNNTFDAIDTIQVPAVKHHIYTMAAERLLRAGKNEEAISPLEKALALDPTFIRAHVSLGVALERMNRDQEALFRFERASELDPRGLVELHNLAIVYLKLGRPLEAKIALEKLLGIAPHYPRARESLEAAKGQIVRAHEEVEKARAAVARDPENAAHHGRLADFYHRTGQFANAVKHLSRAVELDPNDPQMVTILAWVLSTCRDESVRDGKRAIQIAERAVEMTKGERPEPLDTLAAAYAEAGDFDYATRMAERALAQSAKVSDLLAAEIERRLTLYRAGKPFRARALR